MGDFNVKSEGLQEAGNMQNDEKKPNVLMESDTKIKLTDIDQFCLEHIFMYLDFDDLLNVADASKYLRLATITPFTRKYGWKQIQIRQTTSDVVMDTERDHIKIRNSKMIFQMLRCFGQMISKLKIFYVEGSYYDHRNYCRVLDYVNEFCAESLTSIRFDPTVRFESIKQPFANVEEISISLTNSSLLEKKSLSAVFPKLRRLIFPIQSFEFDFSSAIREYFPNLQHFEVDLCASLDSKHAIIDGLRLNSHIKSLRIGIPNFNTLEEISEHLQSIENLDVFMKVYRPLDGSQFNSSSIRFSNVKKFSIHFELYVWTWTLRKLPFLFDQLKEFALSGRFQYNDFYNEFLNENPTIEKLTLDYGRLADVTNPKKLQEMLPCLNKITLTEKNLDNYRIDDILQHWANDLKTVNRFRFAPEPDLKTNTVEKLRKMPIDKWHAILSNKNGYKNIVTLERIKASDSRFTHNIPFENKFLFCNCDFNKTKKTNLSDKVKFTEKYCEN